MDRYLPANMFQPKMPTIIVFIRTVLNHVLLAVNVRLSGN